MKVISNLFQFTIYIRIVLESSQFALLTCFNEIYEFSDSTASYTLSLLIAIGMLLTLCGLYVFEILHYLKVKNTTVDLSQTPASELYTGLKPMKYARSYTVILLLRRLLLVSIVILLKNMSNIVKISIIVPILVIYTCTLIWLRPNISRIPNIIEIMNELVFLFLVSFLFYFDSEAKWSQFSTHLYLTIMIGN